MPDDSVTNKRRDGDSRIVGQEEKRFRTDTATMATGLPGKVFGGG